MLIEPQHKSGFVLSDALIGLALIGFGLIIFAQAHQMMNHQLNLRQEQVRSLRQRYESGVLQEAKIKRKRSIEALQNQSQKKNANTDGDQTKDPVMHESTADESTKASKLESLPKKVSQ